MSDLDFTNKVLREAVAKTLIDNVFEPVINELRERISDLHNRVDCANAIIQTIVEKNFSQCPVCGELAMSAPLCERVKFICPHCDSNLVFEIAPGSESSDPTASMRYILKKAE